MLKKLSHLLKMSLRFLRASFCFLYDFYRYLRFSGFRENLNETALREFAAVKTYHSLEKSLSFRNRSKNSGWRAANDVYALIEIAMAQRSIGFQDAAACRVLETFVRDPLLADHHEAVALLPKIESLLRSPELATSLNQLESANRNFGALTLGSHSPVPKTPPPGEHFFASRKSIRTYLDEAVPESIFMQAVERAMYAPSACNRQPWAIYFTDSSEVRDLALSFQDGNRGFGHEVPGLAVIAVDTRAYISGVERTAHLVDGSIFATALIYALHSLGVGSCCLNWNADPRADAALRRTIAIRPEHSVVMMLAYGYPDPGGKVCASPRRPAQEIAFPLEKRLA